MLIEYKVNRLRREVPATVGQELVSRGLARKVGTPPLIVMKSDYDTRAMASGTETSPRTGMPKRQYRRRDMKVEQ